jgi:hypothetical protein
VALWISSTQRFFRATDSFLASDGQDASISSAGASVGGAITIQHGGNGIIPFDVGDAAINGTVGAITNGDFVIAPLQSFRYTFNRSNIGIISVDRPPSTITIDPPPPVPDLSINPVDLTQPPKRNLCIASVGKLLLRAGS